MASCLHKTTQICHMSCSAAPKHCLVVILHCSTEMKPSSSRSRRCLRTYPARIIALVVALSIVARGHAFTGIGRPMSNLKHRVSAAPASSSSTIGVGTSSRVAALQMTAGSSGEEEVGFVEKVTTAWGTVIEQVTHRLFVFVCLLGLLFYGMHQEQSS